MDLIEKELSKEVIFRGKILSLEKYNVELPNKDISTREVVNHTGGVAILPIDNEGNIYLVKQYRFPIRKVLVEIPAGKFDSPNEDPLECGKRELAEEIGKQANKWIELGYIYTTPGFLAGKVYLYLAKELTEVGVNPDDGEFVEVLKVTTEEMKEMIKRGEITDSKSICAFYKYLLI